jgi:hypothetical protein
MAPCRSQADADRLAFALLAAVQGGLHFEAGMPKVKWCGDITYIPTGESGLMAICHRRRRIRTIIKMPD